MSEQQTTTWRPFLLFRSTIFALLLWLNVISLGFAVWDILAIKEVGQSAFGPPIFVIFNSCATFILLMAAIAEAFIRRARTAQVSFECGWTFAMATLYFAAAVDITVMGPPEFCSNQAFVNVCAASAVLVVTTWLSSVTMMLYFLSLYITTIAHYWIYGTIWSTSVYNVPWFEANGSIPETPKRCRKTPHDLENPVFKGQDDDDDNEWCTPTRSFFNYTTTTPRGLKPPTLVHAQSTETFRPKWAKNVTMRRGVDQPFMVPSAKHVSRLIKACMLETTTPPAVPPPAKMDLELPKLHLDLSPRYPSYSLFPESVHDEDKPVGFVRLSQ
ncbi:hypothetical protein EUX98_g7246 [Antrodiella citrinella]|uniref:MARVEL domain-containing protein n=1 Tax=Antrodiella citrinella TaxID=2447956 RepID=A0A4V3XHW3_9APHY|nr:hypothetical protein EUX98_g7246 [Antrodiella citrinella]